jgi:hypothetical protein
VKRDHPRAGQPGLNAFEKESPTNSSRNGDLSSADPTPARAKSSRYFDAYVQALQQRNLNGTRISSPLTADEAEILRALYRRNHRAMQINEQELRLAAVDYRDIKGPHVPPALQGLVETLQKESRPAFIADGLWFMHAMNGAAFNLFGIDPYSGYLGRWEAWHILAAKLLPDSPVFNAHVSTNQYYPPAVDLFFNDAHQYLFTVQMRALLTELHRLSEQNGATHFERWWEQTVAFQLPWASEDLRREIKYWGVIPIEERTEENYEVIRAWAAIRYDVQIDSLCGQPVDYWLGIWETPPGSGDSAISVAELSGYVDDNSEVFFAADFDVNHDFHVNSWPAIEAYLSRLD